MRRLFGILALLFVFASSAYATDVTIGATTIPNFNPSNIGSDRTLTATVTNGSNIVSCSACMPSNTVGLAGFRVNLNGTQYIVQSVSTQSLFVLTTLYSGASGSTSMTLYKYVLLRVYADRAFQPAGETYVVQPGVPGSSSWYKQVGASVISSGSQASLYISEMVMDATTDAVSPTNQAKYTAGFYRTDNSLVQYYNCFEQFALPPTTPTTWTAICTYNSPSAIVPPNRDSYTKSEIDTRFASCSSGQLYYFASSGNVVSCLTLGTNLSITSGVLNATGGGGGGTNIRQAYNAKVDYNAVGNGIANDTTPLQNCINAAQAGGFECYLPGGTYLVTGLTVTGSTMLVGDGTGKTIIYSTTNAAILSVSASAFRGATIQDMTIRGSIAAGSSQNALVVDDGSYVFGVQVRNVTIEDAGNYGFYAGNVYSSQFENMFITNCVNYPLLYAAPAMPSNTFVNIYIGDVRATAPTGFRIKQGDFNCISCNGINNVVASSRIAAVGRKNGVDGDVVNSGAVFDCTNCNFESWVSNGVLSYSSSLINLRGRSRLAVDASGVGTGKPIQFDLAGDGSDFYAQQIARGVIEDSVSIEQALSNYANSQAVHANGFAPIETQGVGPSIASSVPLSTYYDSSTSLVARLSRKDGQAPVVSITSSATYTNPGVRYIEANCPTACTITLPWPGWYQVGQSVMIKDISGAAAANNITITAGSGGTVNGSTYAIATNGGSVILMPNNTTLDWRVVSIGITSGPVTGSGLSPRLATWSAATTLSSTSGLEYDSGNSAVKSPGRFWGANSTSGSPTFSFTNDNGTGMYLAGATTDLGFALNGSAIFTLNSTASTLLSTLNPDVSNTRDLGAAATRWRSGYFQTSAILGAGSTTTGVLTFNNSTNANTFTLQPGVTGANLTYTLPTAYSSGTQCLADNGSGTLSWTACSGGSSTPGGLNTQVQFNDSGNFNGDSGLTYNKTTNVLSTDHAIITQSDTTIVPLIVKAVGASTAELLQIKDSAGNVRGGYATSGAGFYRGFSSAPSVSLANDGKLFYDITGGVTTQQLVLSKNTGQYNPVIVANQASYTANKIPLWSSTSWELENSMMTQGSGAVSLTIAPTLSTSGSPTIFTLTGPAHTGLAADTEATDINLNLNRNVQFTGGGGTFSLQRAMRFQSPTYRATSSETIGTAVLLYLDTPKAGTNMTLTSSYALGISPSALGHNGLYFDFQTSATGNFIEFNSSGSSFGKIVSRTDRANYVFGGHTTATGDTDGFVYIPNVAGVPTGVPTAYTGTVPLRVDSTNSRMYAYFGGAWVNLTGAGGGTPGGSNTQLQYNNSSAFGGISGATSNGTNVTFGSGNLIATTPTITTSLVTGSSSFDLLNTTATTINFGGAATTLNIGATGAAINLGGGVAAAELRFLEPSGSGTNYTAFKAQAQTGNVTYTLPSADGSSGFVLSTNGSGTLSWASGGAATPGGSNKQIQFNNSSSMGGAAGFEYQAAVSPNVSITAQNAAYTALYVNSAATPSAGVLQVAINSVLKSEFGTDGYLYVGKGQNAALPTSGTISGTETTTGTSNVAGGYLRLQGGTGTGTGLGGSIIAYTAAAGGSGTAQNAYEIAWETDSSGNFLLGGRAAAAEFRFYEPAGSGSNYTAFKAQAQAGDLTYTLPPSQSAGVLTNNGSGSLTWAAAGSGLTIGTTAITSGTAGRILYETSGNVVGEIAGSSVNADGAVQFAASARTSGVAQYFRINTPADTGQTASTESVGAYFGGNGSGATVTRTWAAGTVTTQRENVFVAPTYAGASATATFTTAATVAITGAPVAGANAAITRADALNIQSGILRMNGTLPGWGGSSVNGIYFGTSVGGGIFGDSSNNVYIGGAYSEFAFIPGDSSFISPNFIGFYAGGTRPTAYSGDAGFRRAAAGVVRVAGDTTGTSSGRLIVGASGVSTTAAHLYVVSDSASRVGLRVDSAASPSVNIFETTVNGTAGSGFVVTSTGAPSAPGSGAGTSERYGAGSQASGSDSLAIGNGATAVGNAMAIGTGATAGAGGNALAIGGSATADGTNIAIGRLMNVQGDNSIGIGLNYAFSAANTFVATFSTGAINDVFFGKGVTSATPTAYTINGTGGSGSNIAGAAVNIAGGKGTGTGTGGSVNLQTAIVGSSGSSLNTLVDRYIVNGLRKTLTDASTNLFEVALPTLKGCMGTVRYEIFATDGTDVQVRSGVVRYSAVNKAGAYTSEIAIVNEAISASSGTLTATFAVTGGTNKITVSVTPSGSLTETTYYVIYTIENNSEQAITIL